MKTRYGLLSIVLLALVAQLSLAQGGPGMPPGDHMQLMFVSQPPPFGRVDVPYIYTAKAISKDSTAVIHYFYDSMTLGPIVAGFAIDSVTGVVTWTPKAAGWYPISIIARSDRGEFGVQRFAVAVTSGNGIVQGKVTDTTGAPLPGIVIEMLQAVNVMPMDPHYYSFATKTDLHGNYRFSNVDTAGRYILHAMSPDPRYASQWYNGKATALEADVITPSDSPAVTFANFTLRGGIAPLPLISVSGNVHDTASSPIAGAEVFFVHAGFALNANSTVDDYRRMFDMQGPGLDFRMDGHSVHVFRALTDSLGDYSLKVVPGAYLAFARARGYLNCFFVQQSDMLSAMRLLLMKDTTGIDFTLRKLPPAIVGEINGSVLDTLKGIGIPSRIIAFRNRWTDANVHPGPRSFTVDTDSLGAYTLGGLPPGSYIVLALPMGSYAPAFYASDTANWFWRKATPVLINGNSVNGIDIYVHEIPPMDRGFTGITGMVRPPAGDPSATAGALVYAYSNAGVAGFGIADPLGHYEIAGLAPGTYTVTADLPGFDPVASKTATVSYSQTGLPQFATVDLSMSLVTSLGETGALAPESFVLSQNYPNPFNPTTSITYQLPAAAKVDLRVYDVLGQEVAVLASGVQTAGSHTVKFDATRLSTGVYFYRLSAGTSMATMKMLLLK